MKTVCWDFSALDPKNKISNTKLRRLMINALLAEHAVYVGAIAGWENWEKQPIVEKLENLLISHKMTLVKIGSLKTEDKE